MNSFSERALYENIAEVLQKSYKALSLNEFMRLRDEGAVVLDTRNPEDCKKGYPEKAICVSLQDTYALWVSAILKPETKILLVTSAGDEKEAILRLTRIGYDDILGYLEDGYETWVQGGNPVETWHTIQPVELKKMLPQKPCIVDIRHPREWKDGMIDGARWINMNEIYKRYHELPKDEPIYVHCCAGGKSFAIYTLLRSLGLNAIDIKGGYLAFQSLK